MLRAVEPAVGTPAHVQLEVTWRCNWRCVHCYQDDHRSEPLTGARLLTLVDELAGAGTMHLVVTGGEPTARPDLESILRRARGHGIACTLYTNGHLVDRARADRLAPLIAGAEISLLAGDDATHDRLAGVPGAFRRATAAIGHLVARRVPVMVKTTLLRPAAHTWTALAALVDSLGAEWHVDLEIAGTYAGNTRPLGYALTPAERRAFLDAFPRFAEPGYSADPGVERGLCLAGRQFCFIDAFGNVYPCLSFKAASDAREQACGDQASGAKMGNVLTRSFADIWNAPIARRIRDVRRSDFTTCASCDGHTSCSPCMAANYEASGSLFSPAPSICERTTIRLAQTHPNFIPASRLVVHFGHGAQVAGAKS